MFDYEYLLNYARFLLEKDCAKATPEEPMTIIAAMWQDDGSIAIGADSRLTDVGPPILIHSEVHDKLKRHRSAPLAWGTVGDRTLGSRFSSWLTQWELPIGFEAFRETIARQVSEMNGTQREIMRLSKCREQDIENSLFQLLLAGYVDGAMRLIVRR